ERRGRQPARALRKMSRDEIERLHVAYERVVVLALAVTLIRLAEPRERLRDQLERQTLLLQELVARCEIGRDQVLGPVFRIPGLQHLAQAREDRRRDDALPRQQI